MHCKACDKEMTDHEAKRFYYVSVGDTKVKQYEDLCTHCLGNVRCLQDEDEYDRLSLRIIDEVEDD